MYDTNQPMYDTDKRKLFSAVSHGSIFISALLISVAIPLGLLVISDDPIVKDNAKEAVNFHLNVWLWGGVIAVLSFFTLGLFGWVFGPIWFLLHWGLTIIAILHCVTNTEQPYRYPFIFRIL